MDNQRPPQGPHRGLPNKADLQRDYRQRERLAFRNLLGALNEVERTNVRSRSEILRRAAECLRRLEQEQAELQQQLGIVPGNNEIPQPEADIMLSDEDVEWLQNYFAQFEHPGKQPGDAGGPHGGGA
ncbi:uncharacterized protein EDB91DRAFT_1252533 [Suillus paluster]|uniref:uncharacterized protein n=1 Tax=Suillus paluster TaxID=48578 RepID=UPI001B877446|nr:uncharacterized protein EDB91DRAFT_1252533 [Suillus paluster]KAG1730674.1 hypothetical protein EDB91DRAFT_1252533 [Suillus paluster]